MGDQMAKDYERYMARKKHIDIARYALQDLLTLHGEELIPKRREQVETLRDLLTRDSDHIVAVWN
jgi:hypothetical protein